MKEAFKIVFQDEYLVVVNKIAKLLVEPSPQKEKITLTSLLTQELNQPVWPCHRLDRETSGLIIYAKSAAGQAAIMDQFRQRQVSKRYLALVQGVIHKPKLILQGKIIDQDGARYGEKPKFAKTYLRVKACYRDFTMVDLEPLTGRTHQLRIQLKAIKHPILGERKYAFGRDFTVKFKRLALHAYYLRFRHPLSKDLLELKIELAADMQEFLNLFAAKR